ncbi:hypothetical protein TA3x_001043 [Tundrisphaera sp. TA3]|uniref:hypothetical protein n=1 Tax=Tundrisphaera sp. TA3 TaxID=3435775 RepID=UPI003EBFAE05
MRNLEGLIQYLVPFSFLAIWAITSLLNRETKPTPARRPMPERSRPNRPGEPTLRWGAPPGESAPGRMTLGREDDIVILSSETATPPRRRQGQSGGTRRTARVKPSASGPRKLEGTSTTPLVSGVNQNVNQQLATAVDIQPLAMDDRSLTSVASRPTPPSSMAPGLVSASKLAAMMADPARLREAFLMSEMLRPPVALRPRGDRRI